MALTEKQKLFCNEYLIDLNATQAAIRAGYSGKTAYRTGADNLKKPQIAEYISEKMRKKEDELIAKQDEVLRYLTEVMRREKKESIVVTLSRETSAYVPDEHGSMRKQTIKEEVPETVEIPAKLSDANKAAELLGKRYGLFTDKLQLNAPSVPVILDNIPEGDANG